MRDDLIERTLNRIEVAAPKYKSPALLVSFGKDSLVLLELLRHFNFPVVCYKPPYQQHKWLHAATVAAEMGLVVHSYPPAWVALQERAGGGLWVVSAYSAGHKNQQLIYQRVAEGDIDGLRLVGGGVCGLHDVLKQPKGQFDIAWDLFICAQKTGDPGVKSSYQIDLDVRQVPYAADTIFPMRDWTDADVWEYITSNRLPFDTNRYEFDGNEYREVSDTWKNPDVVNGCFACLKKDGSKTVKCPRLLGMEVDNVSERVPYFDYQNDKLG